jgi:hypothetical protein
MTDESMEAVAAPEQDAPVTTDQAQADAPAGAKNTDKPTPEAVPYDRFQEVTRKVRELEAQAKAAAEVARKSEEQRLAGQQKYQELWEREKAEKAALESRLRESELNAWRQQAATEAKLPASLAARLRGDTFDDLMADAQELARLLPRPTAPNVNGASGDGGAPGRSDTPWALQGISKEEFAARYGLNPRFLEG